MRDAVVERSDAVSTASTLGSSTAAVYRGPDRRARPPVDGPPPAALAGAALILGALIPLALADTPTWLDPDVVGSAGSAADAMALGFALLGVVVQRQQSRLGGDGWPRRLATVLLVLALAVVGCELVSTPSSWWGAVVPIAGRVVVLVAAGELLLAAAVDASRRAWWPHVAVSLGAVGALAATVALEPDVGHWLQAGGGPVARPALVFTGAGALAVAMFAVAVAVRRNDHRPRWAALLFVSLAASDVALAVQPGGDSSGAVVASGIRLTGVLIVLYLSLIELRNVAVAERERTVEARLDAARAADRLVHHVRRQEEVVHDARNALLVIDGGLASVVGDGRDTMVVALRSELRRLSQVLQHDRSAAPQPVDVINVLEPMVVLYESAGLPVHLAGVGRPWAIGDPADLVEVVQNLIDNALRHGGASDVDVRVVATGEHVWVQVADRGPGIDPADRERIFERGTSTRGSGIGLNVARCLIEAQGGSISVAGRRRGGSVFTVRLPRFHDGSPPNTHPEAAS